MVSWTLVHWLLVVFHVRAYLHTGETKAKVDFATKFHVFSSVHLSILFPARSVTFQHKGYELKYESWLFFSNQKYESGPEAPIHTYSQVISIKLSGGLTNLSSTLLCEVSEASR